MRQYPKKGRSRETGKKLKKDRRTQSITWMKQILRITNFTQRIRTFGARGIMGGSPFKGDMQSFSSTSF